MRHTPLACMALFGMAVYACATPVDLPDDLIVGPLDQAGAGPMAGAGGDTSTAGTGGSSAGAGGAPNAAGASSGAGVGGTTGGSQGGSAGVGGALGTAGVAAAGTGGGVGGAGGDAGGAGGENTAGTEAQAGTGGEPPTGSVFNPPDTCDFDDTTGCEDLACANTCTNCPVARCQALVDCIVGTDPICSTVDDPLCGADPPNADVCTGPYQSAGNGNPADDAFVAVSDLIECLCTTPRPE